MTNKKTTELTAAGALTGSELLALVQSGANVKETLSAILTWITAQLAARLLPVPNLPSDEGKFVQYDSGWVLANPPEGLPTYTAPGDNGKVVTLVAGVPSWAAVPAPAAAGSDRQLQLNNGGALGGALKAEIDANGSLRLVVDATPATPAAGKLTHHAAYLGALERPAWVNSEAKAHLAQDLLAAKRFVSTTALVGNASRLHVGIADSTEGTAGAVTPTFADLPNSLVKTHVTSAATAGSNASLRYGALYLARGAAAGAGGFRVRFLWHPNDAATVADARCFVGLIGQTGAIGNVNPSTLTNIIGVGADNGETNLSLMHNDGSGTAAKTSLGASFPQSDTSKVYELILEAEPNASKVHYQVRELGSGAIARGSITTELPAGDQGLTHHFFRNNGATAAAVRFGFGYVYAERDL